MATSPNVHTFNDGNFDAEVLKSSVPVLVDFTATWCGPCKMLAPIVEKLADELGGKIKVGKLDIDDSPQISAKYAVRPRQPREADQAARPRLTPRPGLASRRLAPQSASSRLIEERRLPLPARGR
jgi:thiol-disulfide isomerase/thioredoxin